MYKDEKGHFTTKENNGGPCHHENDKSEKYTGREPGGIKGDLERAGFDDVEVVDDKTLKFTGPNAQKGWLIKENENSGFDVFDEKGKKVIDDFNASRGNIATAMLQKEQNPDIFSGFDEDYEEEFKIYEDKIREELNKVNSKEAAEYVSDLIDDNMEAGYISEEKADELCNELDKKIDEFGLEDAIKNADDDVLDEEFGKDTPERKLAQAIKGPNPSQGHLNDMGNKTGTKVTRNSNGSITIEGDDGDIDQLMELINKWKNGK